MAFYSTKLNSAQVNYSTTERELLSIVEALKEFHNILLGQQIKVYTDHKNLTYKQFNTERIMRWSLISEEYVPERIYIQGNKNVIADALSRPDITTDEPKVQPTMTSLSEHFALSSKDLPEEARQTNYKTIRHYQKKDKH